MGRRGGRARRGLDLRLLRADPRDRLRHCRPAGSSPTRRASARSSPPTSSSTSSRARSCSRTRRLARSSGPSRARASSSAATRGTTASPTATTTLRVLEFFAPPPATGHLGRLCADEAVPHREHLCRRQHPRPPRRPQSSATGRSACSGRADAVLRLDLGVLVGLLVSTEHLTVGTLRILPGQTSARSRTPARSSSTSRAGRLRVHAGGVEATLAPGDGFSIPAGTLHATRPAAKRAPRRSSASRPHTELPRPTGRAGVPLPTPFAHETPGGGAT